LNTLSLDFSRSEGSIGTENLVHLANSLKDLKKLKNLQLEFHSCKRIEEAGIVDITKAIEKLEELSEIQIGFQ